MTRGSGNRPGRRTWMAAALAAAVIASTAAGARPAAAAGELVTLTGELRLTIEDRRDGSETRTYLVTDGGRTRLRLDGTGTPGLPTAGPVVVTGTRLADGSIRVTELEAAGAGADGGPAALAEPGITLGGAAWPGPAVRRIAVVLGSYGGDPSPIVTPAVALEAMTGTGASVRAFFETASRGRVTIEATVLGPWNLGSISCLNDVYGDSIEAVEARAAANGINLSTFDHIMMWTDGPCGWQALGDVYGQYSHLNQSYPDDGSGRKDEFVNVAVHELGHNLGFFHANALVCEAAGTPVPMSSAANCDAVEYGDPFSTMGGDMGYLGDSDWEFLSPLYSSAELDHLGWLDADEVQTVTAAGTYDLVPTYGSADGVRLLRIRRVPAIFGTDPTDGRSMASGWWTLELRSAPPPGAFDTFAPDLPVHEGVLVRYVDDALDESGFGYFPALGSLFLVDMGPSTVAESWDHGPGMDAPLEVGETFIDPGSGAQVTLQALDGDGATVSVAFPGGPPPPVSVLAPATITGATADSGQVTVSWSPPATSATAKPTGYTVFSYPGLRGCLTIPDFMPNSCTVSGLADGTAYRFVVSYGTASGRWVVSAPSDPVVPLAPPSASMGPLPAWSTSTAIPVTWSGTDAGGPVDSFDVRYRTAPWNGGFGSSTTWQSATTAETATYTSGIGRTTCFSARSRAGGRTGAWSTEACTAVPVDDRSLNRGTGWKAITGDAYYRGTAVKTTRKGATLTRTNVTARKVALLVSTCPTCGSVKVYWNGTYRKTISLASATSQNGVLKTALSFDTTKTGTLKLVSTSTRRVTIDGVGVSAR